MYGNEGQCPHNSERECVTWLPIINLLEINFRELEDIIDPNLHTGL